MPLDHSPTGIVLLLQPESNVIITLLSPTTRRYLVDCAVTPGVTIGASAPSASGSNWQAQATSSPGTSLVSFYTPPLPPNVRVRLYDAAPQMTNAPASSTGPTLQQVMPPNQQYRSWRLTGCEITPVAAP
jgi:hypothetical protein